MLEQLNEHHHLKAVVTQPDKPRGRHGAPRPSAAKVWAERHAVPVLTPSYLKNNDDFVKTLAGLKSDICVVAAYGRILTREILEEPRLGFINIHGSVLPAYRGAAPIQRAIMDGLTHTGVTIMHVEVAMDAGDIIAVAELPILRDDNYGTLSAKMAVLGADALTGALGNIENGAATRRAQDEEMVTYAPPITKNETAIDWRRPAVEISNLVRALAPKPGAYTRLAGNRLKILKTGPVNGAAHDPALPGSFGRVEIDGGRIKVATGAGLLELLDLQPEGKRIMSAADFIRGHRVETGALLNSGPDQKPS